MNGLLRHRGYKGSVLYSAEDHLLHGRILGVRDFILYDGQDVHSIEENFREAVDEYLRFCQEDGRSPDLPQENPDMRVTDDLHGRAAKFAQEHNVKLNQLVEQALTQFLEHAE